MTDPNLPPSLKTLPLRLRRYQQERLPLWKALALAGAMSYSAIGFSALVSHRMLPGPLTYIPAFLLVLLFLLQRRIADDLRNLPHDRKHQPDMPVPRGLVSANELRLLFALCLPVQALICIALDIRLLGLLMVTTVLLMILTVGVGPFRWNRLHPLFYLFFHRLAAPMTLYMASACEWMPRHGAPHPALIILLLVSYSNSFVLEIGRNFRLPGDGSPESRSYAMLWGPRRGILIWWMLINFSAILSTIARMIRHANPQGVLVLVVAVVLTGLFAYRFAAGPEARAAKRFETLSVLWSVTMFLTLVLF